MKIVLNFVFFQLCWVACVWGGAQGYWWLGPAAVLAFLCWELLVSHNPVDDLKLVAVVAVIGLLVDSGYVMAGLMQFATPIPSSELAPIWIVAMWVSFALTLNHSMAWLKGKETMAVVFGALGGPFAYWIAWAAWDAVEFTGPLAVVLGVVGVVWAVATPLLLRLADMLHNVPQAEASLATE